MRLLLLTLVLCKGKCKSTLSWFRESQSRDSHMTMSWLSDLINARTDYTQTQRADNEFSRNVALLVVIDFGTFQPHPQLCCMTRAVASGKWKWKSGKLQNKNGADRGREACVSFGSAYCRLIATFPCRPTFHGSTAICLGQVQ